MSKTNPKTAAEPQPGAAIRPKAPRWMRLCILIGAAVLIAAAVLLAVGLHSGPAPTTEEQMAETVLTCGDFSMTNTELGYYFWNEYFYLVGSYGEYLPDSLDTSKPLEQQMYDEDRTWQDYVLEQTVETVEATMSMVFAARDAGFTMPEDYQAAMESTLESLSQRAGSAGYTDENGDADLLSYLSASYGPAVTLESFEAYLENSHLAAAYSDALYDAPVFTDGEISAYYDLHAGDYAEDGVTKDDEKLRNLRIVLIAPQADDEESWAEAKASAETLYATWQAESGTEDDFSAMAAAHSSDASTSAAGGLMRDVRRSDLSGSLAQWAFDGSRAAGDTAVVQSNAGWVIAYYVGQSDRAWWQAAAEEDLRREAYQNEERAIRDCYSFELDLDHVHILAPQGLYGGSGAGSSGQDD